MKTAQEGAQAIAPKAAQGPIRRQIARAPAHNRQRQAGEARTVKTPQAIREGGLNAEEGPETGEDLRIRVRAEAAGGEETTEGVRTKDGVDHEEPRAEAVREGAGDEG